MSKPQWLKPRLLMFADASPFLVYLCSGVAIIGMCGLISAACRHPPEPFDPLQAPYPTLPKTFKGCSVVNSDTNLYKSHQSSSRNGPIQLRIFP